MTSVPCKQVMYSDGEQPVSLGETLVKAGYAKLVNWGLEMMSVNAFNLREAERNAKQQRVGIWRNYVAPATAGQSVTLSMPQKPDRFADMHTDTQHATCQDSRTCLCSCWPIQTSICCC